MDSVVELQLYIYFDDMYTDIKYCVLKVDICDAIMTHKLKHYDAPSSVIYIISMLNNLSHRIHTETSLEAALFFVSVCSSHARKPHAPRNLCWQASAFEFQYKSNGKTPFGNIKIPIL